LIGADKSVGLYVHDLSGATLQFLREGPLNNVDLRGGFMVEGQPRILVAATERERFSVVTWLLDPGTLRLARFGEVPTPRDFGEPYGFCLGRWGGRTWLVANNKEGLVLAWTLEAAPGGGPRATLAHRWKLGGQTEGCVVDDATGALFVGEEDVAIWRMSLARPEVAPARLASADGVRLVADIEGLTLMRDAGRSFLIASSQGDSAYGVWRLDGDAAQWIGRFRIGGGSIDPVTQTDGVDAWAGPIGGFPAGAIAVHDHCDAPGAADPPAAVCDGDAKQQNYKLVDWRDVKAALRLD
jgi:3-phytase